MRLRLTLSKNSMLVNINLSAPKIENNWNVSSEASLKFLNKYNYNELKVNLVLNNLTICHVNQPRWKYILAP
jgi:hypothetical protein